MPGPTGESQRAALSRPRRVRLHQPVEFPAGDLHRPGRGGARRRQRGGGQARRADAADRRRGGAAAAPGRRAAERAASRAGRRQGRRGAGRRSRASPASPSPARPRSAAPINRALAAKDGPIVPLIAETGGINAMIVDATALPEQVTDDVVTSAFRSAGQRCSALRLLCVQEDVADRMLEMIAGAARELDARRSARSGDPCRAGDRRRGQGAARPLDRRHDSAGRVRFRWDRVQAAAGARASTCRRPSSRSTARAICRRRCSGRSCTSCAGAPTRSTRCSTTSPATATASRSASIRASTRRSSRSSRGSRNGNVYVNRNMIGAVVGTQPFGGSGLSGTGPKAGGSELPAALRHRAGGDDQHRGGRRQRHAAGGRGRVAPTGPASSDRRTERSRHYENIRRAWRDYAVTRA